MKILKKDISHNSGFSLIELVIVIAILAILSAVAIPAFVGVRHSAKVSAFKKFLINILKECLVAESTLLRSLTFNDIHAWDTTNSFGDSRGLNFGFSYDSELSSNSPIKPTDLALYHQQNQIQRTLVEYLFQFFLISKYFYMRAIIIKSKKLFR